MFRQRLRLEYSIGGDKRFLSHHDVMRLWHRALRRSGLPLRMSEGFHVRPRVSFAQARGVGIASESEWLEFELADWVSPDTVAKTLAAQLPADIAIRSLSTVAPGDRAIVREAAYVLRFDDPPADLPERIQRLLARREILVERGREDRARRLDIRPLIRRLEHREGGLLLVARCRNDGALRPEEVLAELDLDADRIARCLVTRTESSLGAAPAGSSDK
jgi:radical SAM-linked protein